jgi:predicted DNA-binding transcriptional regulator AlpA
MMGPELLHVDQFCSRFGLSKSLVYRAWAGRVGPPRLKVGRRVFIPTSEAEEWVRWYLLRPVVEQYNLLTPHGVVD